MSVVEVGVVVLTDFRLFLLLFSLFLCFVHLMFRALFFFLSFLKRTTCYMFACTYDVRSLQYFSDIFIVWFPLLECFRNESMDLEPNRSYKNSNGFGNNDCELMKNKKNVSLSDTYQLIAMCNRQSTEFCRTNLCGRTPLIFRRTKLYHSIVTKTFSILCWLRFAI